MELLTQTIIRRTTNLKEKAIPTYLYGCDDCQIEFESFHGINDLPLADCPACDKVTNNRIPCAFTIIDRTPRTLGSYADQKRSVMGNYQYSEVVQKMANDRKIEFCGKLPEGTEQIAPKTDRPFWRPDSPVPDYSLNKLTPEQTTTYVMEGKKPIGA